MAHTILEIFLDCTENPFVGMKSSKYEDHFYVIIAIIIIIIIIIIIYIILYNLYYYSIIIIIIILSFGYFLFTCYRLFRNVCPNDLSCYLRYQGTKCMYKAA